MRHLTLRCRSPNVVVLCWRRLPAGHAEQEACLRKRVLLVTRDSNEVQTSQARVFVVNWEVARSVDRLSVDPAWTLRSCQVTAPALVSRVDVTGSGFR